MGSRAIAEIQFADYIFPAFDQVRATPEHCTQLSKSPGRFLKDTRILSIKMSWVCFASSALTRIFDGANLTSGLPVAPELDQESHLPLSAEQLSCGRHRLSDGDVHIFQLLIMRADCE